MIDESHNLTNAGTLEQPARPRARPEHRRADPRLGHPAQRQAESFAELIELLDPTAIVDRPTTTVQDIAHLFIRRHRHTPDVAREVGHDVGRAAGARHVLAVAATAAEDAVADELSQTWLHPAERRGARSPAQDGSSSRGRWQGVPVLAGRAASRRSRARQKTLGDEGRAAHRGGRRRSPGSASSPTQRPTSGSAKLDALVAHLQRDRRRHGQRRRGSCCSPSGSPR